MIRYALICDNGHRFDGWFRNSAAFDEQADKAQVVCPDCGSCEVEKALMTPSLATSGRSSATEAVGPQDGPGIAQPVSEPVRQIQELAKRVRDYVVSNADYVGDRFAEEARKIHHEEVEPRGIYGEATREEASELVEEGIDFHPLPKLPEDQN